MYFFHSNANYLFFYLLLESHSSNLATAPPAVSWNGFIYLFIFLSWPLINQCCYAELVCSGSAKQHLLLLSFVSEERVSILVSMCVVTLALCIALLLLAALGL